MDIDARLAELDITLPQPWTLPPGLDAAFDIVVESRGRRGSPDTALSTAATC